MPNDPPMTKETRVPQTRMTNGAPGRSFVIGHFSVFVIPWWVISGSLGIRHCQGGRELAEAQAAVAGRHEAVAVHPEAVPDEPRTRLGGEQGIEKHPAAEHDRPEPGRLAHPATDRRHDLDDRGMEPPGDPGRAGAGRPVPRHGPDP